MSSEKTVDTSSSSSNPTGSTTVETCLAALCGEGWSEEHVRELLGLCGSVPSVDFDSILEPGIPSSLEGWRTWASASPAAVLGVVMECILERTAEASTGSAKEVLSHQIRFPTLKLFHPWMEADLITDPLLGGEWRVRVRGEADGEGEGEEDVVLGWAHIVACKFFRQEHGDGDDGLQWETKPEWENIPSVPVYDVQGGVWVRGSECTTVEGVTSFSDALIEAGRGNVIPEGLYSDVCRARRHGRVERKTSVAHTERLEKEKIERRRRARAKARMETKKAKKGKKGKKAKKAKKGKTKEVKAKKEKKEDDGGDSSYSYEEEYGPYSVESG